MPRSRSHALPIESALLRRRLLAWYRRNRRDLPWRRTGDPWAILVSEVMLQQTRVEAVIPHYERFLRRYPTPAALAAAPEEEILACWSGLGYYARARNLRRAAAAIVREHAGEFPATVREARALPGVGAYTAGAVLSIARGLPEPVLDGNVARVLSRLLAIPGDVKSGPVSRRLWDIARSLVPRRGAGEWNQALMELGATVCRPASPACATCPAAGCCEARRLGIERDLPRTGPRRRAVEEPIAAAVIRDRRGRLLLTGGREGAGLVRGLLEPPWVAGEDPVPLRESVLRVFGVRADLRPVRPRVRHSILHRRLRVSVWAGEGKGRPRGGARWVEAPASAAVSSLARKILAAAGSPGPDFTSGERRSARGRTRGGPRASGR